MKKIGLLLAILSVVFSLILMGTAPLSPSSAATSGIIKIGHIRPLTGNMAATSNLMVKAFDLAFKQINYQVAGKQIQIIVGDSQGLPQTAVDVAKKMVENDKVAMIIGPTNVNEDLAVAGYMNQLGIPHILSSQMPMEQITSNQWCFGLGGTIPQISSVMGAYTYEKLGYKKINVLTVDNASGRTICTPFMNAFKSRGGQIVQEQYVTVPCQDFAPYLTVMKDADAVAAWTSGADSIKFLIQYHEMGIGKRFPLVGIFHGAFFSPFILKALPPAAADALIGALVPTPYSPLIDTAVNKKFVPAMQAHVGVIPDDTESNPYQAGLIMIEALKATGGDTTPVKLRQALIASTSIEGPQGIFKFDQKSMSLIMSVYINKIVKQGSDYLWQPVYTYHDVPPRGL